MNNTTGPKSWAEDISTYRETRGSQSLSTLNETSAPKRYSRTNYVPFCDTRHKLYSYNDFIDGKDTIHVDPTVQIDRCRRHGWNDTSLLKYENSGFDAKMSQFSSDPSASMSGSSGHGRRALHSPPGRDGRHGLFGVLQMTEQGQPDSWIGHALINPGTGKACPSAPPDPKRRQDLFDVIATRNPGNPSDDVWIGNFLIDPAKGKAKTPGPEQRRGRKDLTHIFTQSILSDPERLEKLKKGNDQFCDSWIGNALIDPTRGRINPHEGAEDAQLNGPIFRSYPRDWSDHARRHTRYIPCPAPPAMQPVIQQTAPEAENIKPGKRRVPTYPFPNPNTNRRNLYSEMTYRPVSEVEKKYLSKAFDDGGVRSRRHLLEPGRLDPEQAAQLLSHSTELRPSMFVRKGGLAQENNGPRSSSLRAFR
mmetsp:Transcript_12792/g.22754  ORF Transcript_12792/g.22754 Transcript_12792/m.22754 type:complete len:420 (-) Transcript_12792:84-1343(-)|eukprot:CAMPEP_0175047628 /NCGR_PEP_ID=MMETSP0052_2-20121109/5710_1 /TAXON_ID=51329 ORGANISM="Polytomella parva, Strain SAG 63-3" /NCGR_SAMPLE_ID=MMETSP0052_2 /ASSEMBLY_ACC=CAM_ASM_000194 /LENGTH=419 /DNA_ID=CAMNT_0016311543 /DNA_START=106 /DNA_END=1365 /DNA_ORIENTATION=-